MTARTLNQPEVRRLGYAGLLLVVGWVLQASASVAAHAQESPQERAVLSPQAVGELILQEDRAAVMPALRDRFQKATDKVTRQSIASALVRLGDRDPNYWNVLFSAARAAVESDIPTPFVFDTGGRIVRGKSNQELMAWAKNRGVPVEEAVQLAVYGLPTDVMTLAMAADPRGTETLIRGLESRNHMIVFRASQGLARLQATPTIKQIIKVASASPAEAGALIAEALVFFDDPDAQATADRLVTDKILLGELRKLKGAKGPKGIWGF